MSTIIAGGFETYVEAQDALKRLAQAGVNEEYLCEFRVNPPGALKGGVDQEAQPDHTVVRPAEAMVAVNVEGAGISEQQIVAAFKSAGAWKIERTDGVWEDGEWKDFDPVAAPHLIGGRDPEAGRSPTASR